MENEIIQSDLIRIILDAKQIKESNQWDEYLAWCISQENCSHE
jgi:hypothetical protein